MRTLPAFLHLARRWHTRERISLVLWGGALVLLEIIGRQASTDLGDALAVAAVALLVVWTSALHRQKTLRWVQSLGHFCRSLWRKVGWQELEFGVDFRGSPPIRSAVPPLLSRSLIALFLAASGLAASHPYFPGGVREFLIQGSYSIYLLLLSCLWAALLAGTLLLLFLPLALLHDRFIRSFRQNGRRRGGLEVLSMTVFLAGICAAALFLPVWLPLVSLGLSFVVSMALLTVPSGAHLTMVWRSRGGDRRPASLRWREFASLQLSLIFLVIMNLVLLSRGESLLGTEESEPALTMPITRLLGMAFLWVAVVGVVGFVWQILLAIVLRFQASWSQRLGPVLFVRGVRRSEQRNRIRQHWHQAGWRCRFEPQLPRKGDVVVEYSPQPRPLEEGLAPGPMVLSMEELLEDRALHRCQRRDVIQRRRELFKALQKLFKIASRRRFQRGDGFWVGPQHWFITGLSRDRTEKNPDLESDTLLDETIGPHYHQVLRWPVRSYLYQVLHTVGVDLIFVEDGVRFRGLRKVLESIFEVYDIFAGEQRVEEKHFVGLPRLRVVIHDFELDQPYRSSDYPEPDYEDIGRARVLHVFVDRGDAADPTDVPLDFEDIPLPKLSPFASF